MRSSIAIAVLLLWNPGSVFAQGAEFRRGDADGDGIVLAVADGAFILEYLFPQSVTLACLDAADSNDDGYVDLADVAHIIGVGFAGVPANPPGPDDCGVDPTPDALGCRSYATCDAVTPFEQSSQLVFVATSAITPVGSAASTHVLFSNSTGLSIAGWNIGLCHDSPLQLDGVTLGSGLAGQPGGAPDFNQLDLYDTGWQSSLIFDMTAQTALAPGLDIECYVANYKLTAPEHGHLDFCGDLGSSALATPIAIVPAGGYSVCAPTVFGGVISEDPIFKRGDTNGDGAFNLADVIVTLDSGFAGGPPLQCSDAADCNDDGTVDIADPVCMLITLFSGGPAPAAPGIERCSIDPTTSDSLGCESYDGC